MYDRSNSRFTMAKLCPILLLCVMTLCSCSNNEVSAHDAPKVALEQALDSLFAHRYNAYIDAVDFAGVPFKRKLMTDILQQHVEGIEQEKGVIMDCRADSVLFQNDSVATVYYKLMYSTGVSEMHSQKMNMVNGDWKIRIRD